MALYLDQSTPLADETKRLWLLNVESPRRASSVLLFVRPRRPSPRGAHPGDEDGRCRGAWPPLGLLHKILRLGARDASSAPARTWLILRHFHIGSEVLDFVARNVDAAELPLTPLKPRNLEALEDHLFVRHDLNLFNFVIRLGRPGLRDGAAAVERRGRPDFRVHHATARSTSSRCRTAGST